MSSGKKGFINTKETFTKSKKAGTSKNNFPEEKVSPKKKVIIKPKKKYDSDDDTDDSDYDDNSHSRSESEDVISEEEVSESENETESSDEYGHHDSEDDSDDDNNDSDEESDDDDAKDDEINGGGELGSLDSDDDDDEDSDSEDDDITDSDDDDDDDDYDDDDDDDDEDYNQGFLRHKDSINLTKEEMVTGGKIPLPQGWEERFDERSQRVYYVDHNTKTTHWDPPESVTQELMKRQGYTDCYGMDPDGYDRELYPDPALFAIEALGRGPPQGKKSSMKPPVRLIIDDSLARKGETGDDDENKGDVYIEDDGDKDVTDITEEEIDIRNSDHNYIADLILALITSINMSYEMFIPEDEENHNGNKDEKKGNTEEEDDDGEDIIVIDDDEEDDSDDDTDADEDKKNGVSDNNKGKSKPNDEQNVVILNQPSPSPSLPNDADDQKQKGRRRKKSIDGTATATATSPLATKVEGAGTAPGTNDVGENESHFDDEDDRSSGITESGSNDLSEAFEGESELVPLTEEEEEMRIFYVTHTHRISRPGSKYQLKVKDYAPTAFEFMRRMCHISRKEYLRLWNTPRLVTSARYKKSFALFSSDKRFILRIITHNEAKTLFKMLPEYIRYVVKNPQTTLPKIFGLHRLIKSSENIYFIVCNNMFGSKIRKSYYDVRSSSLTRKTIFSEANAEPSSDDIKMHIHEDDRNRLLKQIESDCNFLKQNRIMGYNLVVAITIRKKVDPNSESASASAASSTADDESKKKKSKKKKDGNEEGNDDDFGGSQAGTNSLTTIQRIPTPTPGVVKIFCQQPKKGFVFFIEETYNPQLQNVPRKLKVATKGGNVAATTNGTQTPAGNAQSSSSTVSVSPAPTNNTSPQANSTSPSTSTPKLAQRTASPAIAIRQQQQGQGGDPATANSGSLSSSMPPSPMKANKKSSTLTDSTLATSSCSITSDLDMSSGGGSISLPTASSLPDVDLNTWAAIVSEKKYKAVYSVAITNILKTYGMGAKFSEWFRSVKFRRDSLIDAEPNIYADRLIKFASEAITTKPPKKAKKKKNKDETKKPKK